MRMRICAITASKKTIAFLIVVVVAVFVPVSPGERGAALAIPIVTPLTDISGEDVAKQIDLLSSPGFGTRQAAQEQLIAWAGESLENFQLVRQIVNAYLADDPGLEARRRLNEVLVQTSKLGATITIDDSSDIIKVTSDGGDETKISIDGERVEIQSPFFAGFIGPTKTAALTERSSMPDQDLMLVSDFVSLERLEFGNALVFISDTESSGGTVLNCKLIATVVCIPETGGPQDVAKLIFGDKSGFLVLNVISDVPEPSAALLLGTGLVALLLRRCVSRLRGPLRARRDGVRQSAWDVQGEKVTALAD